MRSYISDSVRKQVAVRARFLCEYCKITEEQSFFAFQIDHVISIRHGGDSTIENLAWTCYPCNHAKGADIGTILLPEIEFVRLFNPRIDQWDDHFELEHGLIHGKTHIALATIKLLKLNDVDRIIERQEIV